MQQKRLRLLTIALAVVVIIVLAITLVLNIRSNEGALLGVGSWGTSETEVLRIGNDGEPQSLDPHFVGTIQSSRILDDIYLGLATPGPDGFAIPGAAERWDISEDGLTYTFHMRKGHTWSDGTPVTADDFEYSWRRVLNPETAASVNASLLFLVEGAQAYASGEAGPEGLGFRAVDDKTFEVKLRSPAPYFLEVLPHNAALPVPPHKLEEHGELWSAPENITTNGAYVPTEWEPNALLRLIKNKRFFDAGNVFFDEVHYLPHEDRTTLLQRYRAGEVDVTRDLPSEQISLVREQLADSLRIANVGAIYYYTFNVSKPPFDDERLRHALSQAIDRETITDKILTTGEIPAYSFVPEGTGNYQGGPAYASWKGLPFAERQDAARALLAEAGYGPDNPLSITLRYNTSENHKRVAVAVAAMWKEIGVETELFNTDISVHYDDLEAGDFQVARAGWFEDYSDPDNYLFLLGPNSGTLNFSQYDNPEYNRLLDEAAAMTDLIARAGVLFEAETILMADQPIAPIYYYVTKELVAPALDGWVDNPLSNHPARYLYWE